MIKLNLGSGYKRYENYVNVDCDTNCNPDFVIDIETQNLPFSDSSVSHVKAIHILEHLGQGFFHCLQELYRVCENGCIIEIEVPHYTHLTFIADPTHKRPITTEGLRLFSKNRNRREIETCGTASTLGLMYNVDFEIVSFNYILDPYYDNILKELSAEARERLGREVLNLCISEHIKLQVIKDDD